MTDAKENLNARQRLFCEAYVRYFNAHKAALEAGYSEKTAYSTGSENLKEPDIRAYVDQLLAERTIGKNEVLARLTEIATFDIGDIADDNGDIDFSVAKEKGLSRAVKSIKKRITKDRRTGEITENIEYDLYDAQNALIQLGRYYALFTDKTDLTSGGDKIIPTFYVDFGDKKLSDDDHASG